MNELLVCREGILLPDVGSEGTGLEDVDLVLDLAAAAEPLLHWQASSAAAVPAARLDGEAVGADAEAGERLAVTFIGRGGDTLGVHWVDRHRRV